MNGNLAGRTALVTGGTRGIGKAIVLGLARAGSSVMASYGSDTAAADQMAKELNAIGPDHLVFRADAASADDTERTVRECRARFGRLHTVVHNAGVISHVPYGELSPGEWHRIVNTNLTAAYALVRGTLPLLADDASIIMIGSGSAMVGLADRAHYTAAKAGLAGLVRSLAKELGPRGIRVNLISPGVVDTGAPIPAEVAGRYRTMTPLGRLGRPEEVAAAAVFLAGRQASFVSGSTLCVDGGI